MDAASRQTDRLLRKCKQGRVALFLGAGASKTANLPGGLQLADMLYSEFLNESIPDGMGFIEACSNVIDAPGVDRGEVEEFIRQKLDAQPSVYHRGLAKIPWAALFTTNYDDLIETGYRIEPEKVQRCEVQYNADFTRNSSTYNDSVFLFKLMGCVNGRDANSAMALSRADYNKKLRSRTGLFSNLADYVKDGSIVYIGYGFSDEIVRTITDEVTAEIGQERVPWGWALLPEGADDKTVHLLQQRRILPLRMSFEEFIEWVAAGRDIAPVEAPPAARLVIDGIDVEFAARDERMYALQFDFVHEALFTANVADETKSKRDFLEGRSEPWTGTARGWSFQRPGYQRLLDALQPHLEGPREGAVPIVGLFGPAGSGKSITALSVAYHLYRAGGYPCIMLRPEKEDVDLRVIDSFVRAIPRAVDSALDTPTPLPRTLILIDEAPAKVRTIQRLKRQLESWGIPAVLLAIARENEWKTALGDIGPVIQFAGTVDLPDHLEDEQEATGLLRHVRSLGIFTTAQDDDYWLNQIRLEWENSFTTALYMLAEPTRPPLEAAIRGEFGQLPPVAQRAYRYVCLFHQWGLALSLELLARAVGCEYSQFLDEVYDPHSVGVIVDDVTESREIRFRARTRLVAQKVVETAYADQALAVEDLRRVVRAILPQNTTEVNLVRALLVDRLGPKHVQQLPHLPLSEMDIRSIFEAAFEAGARDSVMLHHYGIMMREAARYDDAEDYTRRAMAVLNDEMEMSHFRTESRQNLVHSLAMIDAYRGREADRQGRHGDAQRWFEEAVKLFRNSRRGDFPNMYPYYSETWMLFERAKAAQGFARIGYLAAALQVVDEAADNLSAQDMATVAEMEAQVVTYMGDLPALQETLETALSDPRRQDVARYLMARNLLSEQEGAVYDAEGAYAILQAALANAPEHEACLRLSSRLFRRIPAHKDDWQGWWEILQRRARAEGLEGNASLLFDLAFCACQMADYTHGRQYLEQCEQTSAGHRRRSGIIQVVRDREADRQFTGIVRSIGSIDGWLNVPDFGDELKFLPKRQDFTPTVGQRVSLSVALNYRGALAIALRPID